MFLHACLLRARLILRHLLTACEPQGPTDIKRALCGGIPWRGFRNAGVFCWPCPELKPGGSFPKPDHPLPDVFVPLQGCGVRISLMSSSLSQRQEGKSYQLARSCRTGLRKWRALPALSDFTPITASHRYFFRCSRFHSHTIAIGRISTGTQTGDMDGMVLGSDPPGSGGIQR